MFSRPSTRFITVVSAILAIVIGSVVATNTGLIPLARTPQKCPGEEPAPQITLDEAFETVSNSYPNQQYWELRLWRMAKYCDSTRSWWSSNNPDAGWWEVDNQQVEWQKVLSAKIPEQVRTYVQAGEGDLVFYVFAALQRGGIEIVDQDWVDGISSQLVAKVNVAV